MKLFVKSILIGFVITVLQFNIYKCAACTNELESGHCELTGPTCTALAFGTATRLVTAAVSTVANSAAGVSCNTPIISTACGQNQCIYGTGAAIGGAAIAGICGDLTNSSVGLSNYNGATVQTTEISNTGGFNCVFIASTANCPANHCKVTVSLSSGSTHACAATAVASTPRYKFDNTGNAAADPTIDGSTTCSAYTAAAGSAGACGPTQCQGLDSTNTYQVCFDLKANDLYTFSKNLSMFQATGLIDGSGTCTTTAGACNSATAQCKSIITHTDGNKYSVCQTLSSDWSFSKVSMLKATEDVNGNGTFWEDANDLVCGVKSECDNDTYYYTKGQDGNSKDKCTLSAMFHQFFIIGYVYTDGNSRNDYFQFEQKCSATTGTLTNSSNNIIAANKNWLVGRETSVTTAGAVSTTITTVANSGYADSNLNAVTSVTGKNSELALRYNRYLVSPFTKNSRWHYVIEYDTPTTATCANLGAAITAMNFGKLSGKLKFFSSEQAASAYYSSLITSSNAVWVKPGDAPSGARANIQTSTSQVTMNLNNDATSNKALSHELWRCGFNSQICG